MARRALALLACLLLGGCSAAGEDGTATLWVTRDRGQTLLVETEVAAGQSLMRALGASGVEIETRYGGRYLQSVDGLAGSLTSRRDWFWFVNGYEGDRSAADYRLRDGDVAWWDFRRWEREGEARVVVGAFPEPFLHGYGGERRPAAVRYAAGLAARARALGEELGAESVAPLGAAVAAAANVLELRPGAARLTAGLRDGQAAGDPVRFVLAGEPDPERRYQVP